MEQEGADKEKANVVHQDGKTIVFDDLHLHLDDLQHLEQDNFYKWDYPDPEYVKQPPPPKNIIFKGNDQALLNSVTKIPLDGSNEVKVSSFVRRFVPKRQRPKSEAEKRRLKKRMELFNSIIGKIRGGINCYEFSEYEILILKFCCLLCGVSYFNRGYGLAIELIEDHFKNCPMYGLSRCPRCNQVPICEKPTPTIDLLPASDPLTFTIDEKISVFVDRHYGVCRFNVACSLYCQIRNPQKNGFFQIQVVKNELATQTVQANPTIDVPLLQSESIIRNLDDNLPFKNGHLVTWTVDDMHSSCLPLKVHGRLVLSSDGEKYCREIYFEASKSHVLEDVLISVPFVKPHNCMPFYGIISVDQGDLSCTYDSMYMCLEWKISRIDNSNRHGSMKFEVMDDSYEFIEPAYPCDVSFSAASTVMGVKVIRVIPLQQTTYVQQFVQRVQMSVDLYGIFDTE